ncbi:MAG: type 4a pilus biogenesis protein PilO [Xanthomonadaceae bacterium]|nr:type 4a pilus biogenesis protein PilO [Xanthomonadaceae bacterium]
MAAVNPKNILLSLAYLPVIPMTVFYLGWLGYGYYTFTTDPASDYSLKLKDIQTSKTTIETLRKKRKDQDQFYKSLEERKARLIEVSQKLAKTKSLLSEEMDLPSLQKLILTEAQRIGLQVVSWQPGVETVTENYVQRSFDLEVKGLYFKLLAFYQRMANSSKIIRIEDFDLTAPNPTQKYVELNVKMKLLAFRYNASKADDIANEASKTQVSPPQTGGQKK